MSFDHSNLLGEMRKKGFTQEKLAATIGISPVSLNRKLAGRICFKQDEIYAIMKALNLNDVDAYFLCTRT